MEQCSGAYACVAMLAGFGLIAFRDPNGIRPLGMAVRKSGGKDYMFASESVVADASGFVGWEDVKPGERDSKCKNVRGTCSLKYSLLLGEAVIVTRTSVSRRQRHDLACSRQQCLP